MKDKNFGLRELFKAANKMDYKDLSIAIANSILNAKCFADARKSEAPIDLVLYKAAKEAAMQEIQKHRRLYPLISKDCDETFFNAEKYCGTSGANIIATYAASLLANARDEQEYDLTGKVGRGELEALSQNIINAKTDVEANELYALFLLNGKFYPYCFSNAKLDENMFKVIKQDIHARMYTVLSEFDLAYFG